MDTKRLHAFAKVVDIGSITRAASILNVAQPALSQQIAALEAHFGKPLLVRSKRGVVPTEAGKILYRHCQALQKQLDQAMLDIRHAGDSLSGSVTVVFAPFTIGAALSTRLLKRVRSEHPGITLHMNENVGGIISEHIMAGKADIALIFDPGDRPGLTMTPFRSEELYFISGDPRFAEMAEEEEGLALETALDAPLILPGRIHTIRQVIDTTLSRKGAQANVVAETESLSILASAVLDGFASSMLPETTARALAARYGELSCQRIRRPNMKVDMALCTSAQLPLSEPALAVQETLMAMAVG